MSESDKKDLIFVLLGGLAMGIVIMNVLPLFGKKKVEAVEEEIEEEKFEKEGNRKI